MGLGCCAVQIYVPPFTNLRHVSATMRVYYVLGAGANVHTWQTNFRLSRCFQRRHRCPSHRPTQCVRACLSGLELCLYDTVRRPIMYAVKVNVKQSIEDAELSEEASRLATALLAEQTLEATGSSDHIQDAVSFSAGNPRVEHLTGKVHLYRQISNPEHTQHRNQLPVS